MALIIEDGSNIAGANSFVTVAECREYNSARGNELPAEDSAVEVLLIRAKDYIQTLEPKFQGQRYYVPQALCFPRDGLYVFDVYVGADIPQQLKDAQCQLGFDCVANDLQAGGTGKEVIEEQVGALKVKYNPNGDTSPQFEPTAANALLEPLFLAGSGASINLISYR